MEECQEWEDSWSQWNKMNLYNDSDVWKFLLSAIVKIVNIDSQDRYWLTVSKSIVNVSSDWFNTTVNDEREKKDWDKYGLNNSLISFCTSVILWKFFILVFICFYIYELLNSLWYILLTSTENSASNYNYGIEVCCPELFKVLFRNHMMQKAPV